jgi:hypothetical protein
MAIILKEEETQIDHQREGRMYSSKHKVGIGQRSLITMIIFDKIKARLTKHT